MSVAYQLICRPIICQHTDQHHQPICWLTCWPRDQPGFGWYVVWYGNRQLADILVDMLIVYRPIVSTNTWLGVHKLDPKSVLFLEKQPWRSQNGHQRMALKLEMEHEFSFGIFCPEKQEYLFRSSIAPRNFLLECPQKSAFTCFPTGNGKQPCKWYKKKTFCKW